jgi:hypothetical protein
MVFKGLTLEAFAMYLGSPDSFPEEGMRSLADGTPTARSRELESREFAASVIRGIRQDRTGPLRDLFIESCTEEKPAYGGDLGYRLVFSSKEVELDM